MAGNEDGTEGPWGVAALLGRQAAVGPHHLNTVTRLRGENRLIVDQPLTWTYLAEVNKVIIKYDVHGSWELTSRCLLWHLLDGHCLVVSVHREPILRLQRVAIFVLSGNEVKSYPTVMYGSQSSTHSGGVDSTGREWIQGGEVCVLPLYSLPSGWAVMNALHHLWTNQ